MLLQATAVHLNEKNNCCGCIFIGNISFAGVECKAFHSTKAIIVIRAIIMIYTLKYAKRD
jgi:hypothetical protein